jgi:rhamnogalacturonan endolyase
MAQPLKMKGTMHSNNQPWLTRSVLTTLGAAAACLVFGQSAFGGTIGVTDNGTTVVVDTHAGLVYTVQKSSGDVTSIKWNGNELQSSSKGSHISSGLGSATVTWGRSPSGTTVNITIATPTLTHYIASRDLDPTMYMATWVSQEPSVGELRWITRLQSSKLPTVPVNSDNRNNIGAIESTDVFGMSDGTTRSKYYGNQRAKDLTIRGVTGSGVGVFMVYGNRESSSGGPFFRDIQNQTGTDSEVYNYMNSGHNQTEAWRTNVLHGPYALVFTSGSTPAIPDMSWMSGLGLQGWVSGRGTVQGTASGLDSGTSGTVGFANNTAQYWANVNSGSYSCPNMKPGTYTATLYQGELAVATASVTVSSGGTSTLNLSSTLSHPATIWKLGTWDGAPTEFLNGGNIGLMHPQDKRNAVWGPKTFSIGSAVNTFPSVQFRGTNTPTTITFNLTSAQIATHTLRIGITSAYNNGRPVITVNSWTSSTPSASSQPNSRSVTIGTYRGNNATFTYSIPSTAFIAGANTLSISVASGSSDLSAWLSASWSYDCLELDN